MHTEPPLPEPLPLSQELLALAAHGTTERVSIQDLLDGIRLHARATLLILFAIPNLLPGIPGTSAITGLPLVFLTLQMLLGRPIWLPGVIAKRSLKRIDLLAVLTRAEPWLARVERVLRPRLSGLTAPQILQIWGGLGLLLSILIMLPIPLGNMLPALSILLIALGLLERDGLFVLAGLTTAALSLIVLTVFYWALLKAAIFVFVGAFAAP
ncbi:MAG: exopolysaccharide biosynthesis protein [Cypionkella sp.]|uniref:exopolysaccharide biosynthesis protein n=1 Tax=Cypionkella sp. TaxID=2811411 RepID=UPI00271D3CE8|nr:exopolysaccharide biosynthesis protein [Cypionkella sp.]MDO8326977.1 exopolysaccharide biosynthesis protein [Cypionkella sp.]